MARTRAPMKWDAGKPQKAGKATGTIYGVPFEIDIYTNRLHSHQTTWILELDVVGERFTNSGQSGGVQRALSCLRDDLDRIFDSRGMGQ